MATHLEYHDPQSTSLVAEVNSEWVDALMAQNTRHSHHPGILEYFVIIEYVVPSELVF